MSKKPFDIHAVMNRIEEAVEEYPQAALFELADDGYDSPFEQAVACIVSIRTTDEVTLPTARSLFTRAVTAEALAQLDEGEIDEIIHECAFHEQKAAWLRELAQRVVNEYRGEMPCEQEALQSFSGIGIKCANLVLGIACDEPHVSVDVHVHRITNRWGYVETDRPEQTTKALEEKLPHRYWVDINRLLVPFGKHLCTRQRPRCSTCPVLEYCQQVGVRNSR